MFPGVADDAALRVLADSGFRQFEFWDWRTHDLAVLGRAESVYGLRPAAFSGNTFAEPLVSAEAHLSALDHLRQSFGVANRLGVRRLVVHVGYADPSRPAAEQRSSVLAGLRAIGVMATTEGIEVLVEPLNSTVDHPGYFLDSLPAAHTLLEEVSLPSVRLLLDVYHMWLMHPDLVTWLPSVLPFVGHVHVADAPGRHEPGTGTIPWPEVMRQLAASGYDGLIGLEYWPSGPDVLSSLVASSRVLGLMETQWTQ